MTLSSVKLFDLVNSLSVAMDMIDQAVRNHHTRVTYIAASIASDMGLDIKVQRDLILAGLLHDIGAFSLKNRTEILQFEFPNPHEHAENGFRLLKNLSGFSDAAALVRCHHVPFSQADRKNGISEACQILHLSDRADSLIHRKKPILTQISRICERIRKEAGKEFAPHIVECFLELALKEYFWLDIVSLSVNKRLSEQFQSSDIILNSDEILIFSRAFSRIIDFKSRFTVTHSSGVSYIASALGKLLGFSNERCRMLEIAADLHDLGKLAVPSELLEKPGNLTDEDYCVIKTHPYYTYQILKSIEGFDEIAKWAGFHHERLDGRGYPFHLTAEKLDQGSRIMAVADIFTAITEDRPYRKGMKQDMVKSVLNNFVNVSALDGEIVSVLLSHYSEIDEGRRLAQKEALQEYEKFQFADKNGSAS
ncbi:HD domain-containing phosphohydrolase [Desulfonema magnum]|uniref:HD domain-containing protein n=1 Tax=Desulfonema magnum TaxID=45655 RepID=A0A975BSR3_9BACT|nr:HD domain-containing phosphohydrolase [Desulfonema magnum]QTA90767.1 HD domain-containing protein [Desulfonema magnum]